MEWNKNEPIEECSTYRIKRSTRNRNEMAWSIHLYIFFIFCVCAAEQSVSLP